MVNEEYFEDWLSDHKEALKEAFIEDNIDDFTKFCEDEFDEHLAEIRYG